MTQTEKRAEQYARIDAENALLRQAADTRRQGGNESVIDAAVTGGIFALILRSLRRKAARP